MAEPSKMDRGQHPVHAIANTFDAYMRLLDARHLQTDYDKISKKALRKTEYNVVQCCVIQFPKKDPDK